MKNWHWAVIACSIIVIYTAILYVPFSSLVIAYVIVARPAWFLRIVARLYHVDKAPPPQE